MDPTTLEANVSPRQGLAATAAFERFVENLPQKPYCSNDPRHFGTYVRQRDLAVEHAYVQPNAPWRAPFITLNLDLDEGSAFAAADARMPDPTFTVVNLKSSHAHLVWQLDAPVFIGKSAKADWLFNATRAGLERMLGADIGYFGSLIQNPTHPRWETIVTGNTFGLGDLARESRPIF